MDFPVVAVSVQYWPKDGSPEAPNHTIPETEADAAAFVVCHHFGVACDSADYLLLHDSDEKLLTDRLETICQTAARIIEAVEGEWPRAAEVTPQSSREEGAPIQ
jgi:hypothetical protein